MSTRSRLAAAALGASAATAIPAGVVATSYIVRPGDTLGDIAIRHGTTVRALVDANSDSVAGLQAGRMLRIPDATLGLPDYARGSGDVESHTVRDGEGVFEVARRFGVDPTALARTNGLGVGAALSAGVELLVPGRLARMNSLLTYVAGQTQLDARLVRAVAWAESGWRQDVVSATGAVGVMQLEPSTGDWISRALAGRRLDIWTAQDNVLAGSLLLGHLSGIHGGDAAAVLASYYQGGASVEQHGLFDDTRRYVSRVTALIALDG